MKKVGILLLILIAAIGLAGCGKKEYVYQDDGMEYTVNVDEDTITNERFTYTYSITDEGNVKKIEIVYPNNSKWTKKIYDDYTTEQYTDSRAESAYVAGGTLYRMIEESEDIGGDGGFKLSPMKVILGIIGVGIAMVPVIAPYQCWALAHGWKYRDAEPSKEYIVLSRVFGCLLAVIWIVIVILVKDI